MRNGWTGGQYSLLRGLIGGGLALYLARYALAGVYPAPASPLPDALNLLAWTGGPAASRVLALAGVLLALSFAAGLFDRVAAIGAGYVALVFCASGDGLGGAAIVLAVALHLAVPGAPYGSWAARGRADPAGEWRYPRGLWAAAWMVLFGGYLALAADRVLERHWIDGSALTQMLEGTQARSGPLVDLLLRCPAFLRSGATWAVLLLTLAAVPLLAIRRSRPWSWLVMAAIQWLCLLLFQPTGLTPLLAVLHLYTFDPAWVRAGAAGDGPAMVFYDGSCALCHGSVRFVLAEDRAGNTFRFAPLDSAALRRSVTEERRRTLPDSIVVQRHDGTLLMRSGAVLYALRRLGGLWRPLAAAGGIVPRLVRDRVYEGIAAVRYRVFGRTVEACPIMPPDLRSRFDLE